MKRDSFSSLPPAAIFGDKDLLLAQQLETAGVRLFNPMDAIRLCDDKTLSYLALRDSGIPQPETLLCPQTFPAVGFTRLDFLDEVIGLLGLPFVIKEGRGSFGQQVYLAGSVREAAEILGRVRSPILFQRFVRESAGRDLRLYVVGDEVVASMMRVNRSGDFRANINHGGEALPHQATKEEARMAILACRKLGLRGGPLLARRPAAVRGELQRPFQRAQGAQRRQPRGRHRQAGEGVPPMTGWLVYDPGNVDRNRFFIDRWIAAAEKRGVGLLLITTPSIAYGVRDNAPMLLLEGKPARPDFVVMRSQHPVFSAHLERMGIPCFNSARVAEICNDKRKTHALFMGKLPMMDSAFLTTDAFLQPFPCPVVVKAAHGNGGRQIYLARDAAEYDEARRRIYPDSLLTQPLCDAPGQDLRVYVLDDQVFATLMRYSDGDFRSNVGLGGASRPIPMPEDVRQYVALVMGTFTLTWWAWISSATMAGGCSTRSRTPWAPGCSTCIPATTSRRFTLTGSSRR